MPSSRRGFLSGLAALPLAGGAALAADVSADTALVDLWRQRVKAVAICHTTASCCDEINRRLVLPDPPPAIFLQGGDRALGLENYASEDANGRLQYPFEAADAKIRRWRRNHWRWQARPAEPGDNLPAGDAVTFRVPLPETQVRADEIAAAWDRHKAAIQAIKDASGVEVANDAWEAADDALNNVEFDIINSSALTLAGLVIKARLAQAHMDEEIDPHPELVAGLVRDILAMEVAA